jgi:hypothetical protein
MKGVDFSRVGNKFVGITTREDNIQVSKVKKKHKTGQQARHSTSRNSRIKISLLRTVDYVRHSILALVSQLYTKTEPRDHFQPT